MSHDTFMQEWEASVTAYMREWEAYVTSAKQEWEAEVISALAEWEAAMSALPDGAPHLIHTPPTVTAETVFNHHTPPALPDLDPLDLEPPPIGTSWKPKKVVIKLKSQADSTPAPPESPDRDPLDMIEK
jgi:hypothetical protein